LNSFNLLPPYYQKLWATFFGRPTCTTHLFLQQLHAIRFVKAASHRIWSGVPAKERAGNPANVARASAMTEMNFMQRGAVIELRSPEWRTGGPYRAWFVFFAKICALPDGALTLIGRISLNVQKFQWNFPVFFSAQKQGG
jgi:hypothetical protein